MTRCNIGAAICALLPVAVEAGAQTMLSSGHSEQGGKFGAAVAGLSYRAVAVGAPDQSVGDIPRAGRVTLHSVEDGAILAVLTSPHPEPYGRFGAAISSVYDYFVVGAPGEGGDGAEGSGTGRVYQFSWSKDNAPRLDRMLASPKPTPGGEFGAALCPAGTYMWPEKVYHTIFAVGAPGDDSPDVKGSGRVYVFETNGALHANVAPPAKVLNGRFGAAVARLEPVWQMDFDGGFIVGAPGTPAAGLAGAGRAHIYYLEYIGGALPLAFSLLPPVSQSGAGFGSSVAGMWSTDSWVVVGSPLEDIGNAPDAGRAYLFSGLTGKFVRSFERGAPEPGDRFGYAVDGVPEDGDRITIGAPGADPAGAPEDAGRVYQWLPSPNGYIFWDTFASPRQQAGAAFGASVAAIYRPGVGDVAIGAPLEDTPTIPSVGRAYAFPARCSADYNSDGNLDLFDFLVFVNAFNAGSPMADCDPNQILDLFDFLCFTNAFNAGC